MMEFNVQFDNPISMDKIEQEYFEFVLDHCDNNLTAASRILGVSLMTIYRRLKRWGIEEQYRTYAPNKEIGAIP